MGKPKLPTAEKRSRQIKANVTQAEYEEILIHSQRAGLSLSDFTRRVVLAMKVESMENKEAMMELLRMNADLKRLGGLFKQAISEGHNKGMIATLLHQLDRALKALEPQIDKL